MGMLRKLFGPSREEIWGQLAQEVGGQLIDGSFRKGTKVVAKVGEWTVTLDEFIVPAGNTVIPITRLRAPYVNPDGFRFSISRKGLFSGIAKFFGMQDVEVGYPEFDDAFIIKGKNESQLRVLLADPALRQALEAQKEVELEVCDDEGWFGPDFPQGVDELRFLSAEEIRDLQRLKSLFDLFAITLHRLCAIGSAYEQDPHMDLR